MIALPIIFTLVIVAILYWMVSDSLKHGEEVVSDSILGVTYIVMVWFFYYHYMEGC